MYCDNYDIRRVADRNCNDPEFVAQGTLGAHAARLWIAGTCFAIEVRIVKFQRVFWTPLFPDPKDSDSDLGFDAAMAEIKATQWI